ncbi:hypothetical protein B0T17DRAFT_507248 [Bombardia bombarda]|uniref:Uncharacterized protein n=1 Tax=Bombardia bombarda TaxID=252184 RepID=A0AA39XBD0_9PEZI|nr:hypothetical protein B0T17DRAFT_507248 [Bombardia bombarda]
MAADPDRDPGYEPVKVANMHGDDDDDSLFGGDDDDFTSLASALTEGDSPSLTLPSPPTPVETADYQLAQAATPGPRPTAVEAARAAAAQLTLPSPTSGQLTLPSPPSHTQPAVGNGTFPSPPSLTQSAIGNLTLPSNPSQIYMPPDQQDSSWPIDSDQQLTFPSPPSSVGQPQVPASHTSRPTVATPPAVAISSLPAPTQPSLELIAQSLSSMSPQPSTTQSRSIGGLTLPIAPDPLGALLPHPVGHTSGGLVVSNQYFAQDFQTLEPVSSLNGWESDAALDEELLALWSSSGAQAQQPVNSRSGTNAGPSQAIQRGDTILASEIDGFQFSNSANNRNMLLPRRIDINSNLEEPILHFITLSRQTRFSELHFRLELNPQQGRSLNDQVKKYLHSSPFSVLVETNSSGDKLTTRRSFLHMALHMLKSENWGQLWFGAHLDGAAHRKRHWPADSTLITIYFTTLLYKAVCNAKQLQASKDRKAGLSRASENAINRSLGGPKSGLARLPTLAEIPSGAMLKAPASISFGTTATAHGVTVATPTPQQQQQQQASSRPLLDALVQSATNAKKRKRQEAGLIPYELEIPANADITYRVTVKDRADGVSLGPAATFRHAANGGSRGAYTHLKGGLEAAGHAPSFEIPGPSGCWYVSSEDDWEGAVLAQYNRKKRPGTGPVNTTVEVSVFI